MKKLEINNKLFNLYINNEKTLYIFDLTDNDNVGIEEVKAKIEDMYSVKIETFFEGCHKRYAKNNFKESSDYSYIFLTK